MTEKLWVWREVIPTDAPSDFYDDMKKVKTTGRAFVMRSTDNIKGATEILGVFDSFELATKMADIGNER